MKIEKSELLRYLGYRGQSYSERIDEEIEGAIALCLELITPRSVIKKYTLTKEPLGLDGTDMLLLGNDVGRHLEGCQEAYILGATVGFEVEKKSSELMKSDPLKGVILDSASICAIESYCDDLCEQLQTQNERPLTSRFSCGYGDFPLSQQKDFVRVLELPKRIGVFMNEESFMLTPQKSVTAVIGVKESGDIQPLNCQSKCLTCENKKCIYRK
ncbi:MAG: methionine synthase [Clostridia bacterium]|nr:methionine synthase [Clostridia bacterium]MDE6758742.1 methionine synthase [Clostridia bacterium]